jgi:hypothetical protein
MSAAEIIGNVVAMTPVVIKGWIKRPLNIKFPKTPIIIRSGPNTVLHSIALSMLASSVFSKALLL